MTNDCTFNFQDFELVFFLLICSFLVLRIFISECIATCMFVKIDIILIDCFERPNILILNFCQTVQQHSFNLRMK